MGKTWRTGEKYVTETYWDFYRENTAYSNDGAFEPVHYCHMLLYKVIEFDEIDDFKEPKSFTKSDLRSGDVVVRQNGVAKIVCIETGTLICKTGYDVLTYINQDFSNKLDNDYDIIEVYRPTDGYHCQFYEGAYKKGKLMYKRQDKKKMTLADIEKELGYGIEVVSEKER